MSKIDFISYLQYKTIQQPQTEEGDNFLENTSISFLI